MMKALSLGRKVVCTLALAVLIVGLSAHPASAGWRRRAVVVVSPAYGVPVETVYTAPVVTAVAPVATATTAVPAVYTASPVAATTYVPSPVVTTTYASPVVTTTYVAPTVVLPARALRPRRVYILP